jgi:hypothetical protein
MKKKLLFLFVLVFALNTVSLSALASCPHAQETFVKKANADLPPCHQKTQDSQKSGHCKGICFCLQAQLSNNILPFPDQSLIVLIEDQDFYLKPEPLMATLKHTPHLRPPIALS